MDPLTLIGLLATAVPPVVEAVVGARRTYMLAKESAAPMAVFEAAADALVAALRSANAVKTAAQAAQDASGQIIPSLAELETLILEVEALADLPTA